MNATIFKIMQIHILGLSLLRKVFIEERKDQK
jgi:hypothetical protein